MPKATLEFNLPEEQEEFALATNAGKYQHVLWELSQWLRQKTKYDLSPSDYTVAEDPDAHPLDPPLDPRAPEQVAHYVFDMCRSKFYELLGEEGLDL